MGDAAAAGPTPVVQLVVAWLASLFTFVCLYVAHMQLLRCALHTRTQGEALCRSAAHGRYLYPKLFSLDLRLRMANAERCNGLWHSVSTVLLSSYGLWSSYQQHGWFQYDAPNSRVSTP